MSGALDPEKRPPTPFDEEQLRKWGSLVARGTLHEGDEQINFVVVSDSHLLKERALMTVHDDHVVISSHVPTKSAYDAAGNRILTQTEAIRSFAKTGQLPDSFILPPEADQ